ncbi:hypothetical protein V6U81_22175 [Micromonospora sp. CPCC 205711]|uniref:hypothetical protein n=1 Tax=Micromonospora sp. CPCC 205547 TaxID=3122400 RepID=UPI002FF3885C
MPETVVTELFADFEADALPTFRPPGVAVARRRVRERRWRRRGLLAGLAALLVGAPTGVLAVDGRDAAPRPTPPALGSGPLPERTVTVPGATGRLTDLRFVDARHAWALLDGCTREAMVDCRQTVAWTSDGGVTWQGRGIPDSDGSGQLMPYDPEQLVVATDREYLLLSSRFFASPADSVRRVPTGAAPPLGAQSAWASPSGFRLTCPGEQQECARFQLVRVGSGKAWQQPPLSLDADAGPQLVEGGDGRLWVTTMKEGRSTVVVSDNDGITWQRLPAVPAEARPAVSPDGTEVWLVDSGRGGVWRLVGARWQQRPGLPNVPLDGGFAAAGAGAILVNSHGRIGYWIDGRYVDQPDLRDALAHSGSSVVTVNSLPDGTIVLKGDDAWRIVGVGSGVDRTWTRFS